MTAAASASDALLERATAHAPDVATAVKEYGLMLMGIRGNPDLVDRMKAAALLVLYAEKAEAAFAQVVRDARTALAEVMAENGVTLDLEHHTVFTADRGGIVRITDEAAIPREFFRTPPPAPDKVALGKALREGQSIPGAVLSNGGAPTLNFRSKKQQAA